MTKQNTMMVESTDSPLASCSRLALVMSRTAWPKKPDPVGDRRFCFNLSRARLRRAARVYPEFEQPVRTAAYFGSQGMQPAVILRSPLMRFLSRRVA